MIRLVIILALILFAAPLHAGTQTAYVWLFWSGVADQVEIHRRTDGPYALIDTVSNVNKYRDTIPGDIGNVTYCYVLYQPALDHWSTELCATTPIDFPANPTNLIAQ